MQLYFIDMEHPYFILSQPKIQLRKVGSLQNNFPEQIFVDIKW